MVTYDHKLSDKVAILELSLREARGDVARLTAAMEALNARQQATRKAAPKNVKKPPQVPIRSVRAEETPAKESRQAEREDAQPVVVADSRYESMHFYYRGLDAYRNEKYDDAVTALRKFTQMEPEHVYRDRAEFLMARAYYLNQEYGLVIVATNLLESRFPHSLKLPEAIYHRGLAYLGLGQKKDAAEALRRVVAEFPQEPVSLKASRKLAELSLKRGPANAIPPLNSVSG